MDIKQRLSQEEKLERLTISNEVLNLLEKDIVFSLENDCVFIQWGDSKGEKKQRYTPQSKGSFFSVHRLPTGGTHQTAINQLWRWIIGKPCLPLSTWDYWTDPNGVVQMRPRQILEILRAGGYPAQKECCICGANLAGRKFDWYYSKRVEGIGCFGHSVNDFN